jgi:hypothetical protein
LTLKNTDFGLKNAIFTLKTTDFRPRYLHGDRIRQLDIGALSLLMGCSSGLLSVNGDYAEAGMALSYIVAGCPMVVANLWVRLDSGLIMAVTSFLRAFWRF